jgi:hypothetical protein
MEPNERVRELGKAQNLALDYFVQKLLVPKIYLDAEWEGVSIPLLAIDRAGVGDVHAVLFLEQLNLSFSVDEQGDVGELEYHIGRFITQLNGLPCQFKYVAIYGNRADGSYEPSPKIEEMALAKNGVGQVGLLLMHAGKKDSGVKVALPAQRFPSSKEILELTDRYVEQHTAAWEVRA